MTTNILEGEYTPGTDGNARRDRLFFKLVRDGRIDTIELITTAQSTDPAGAPVAPMGCEEVVKVCEAALLPYAERVEAIAKL